MAHERGRGQSLLLLRWCFRLLRRLPSLSLSPLLLLPELPELLLDSLPAHMQARVSMGRQSTFAGCGLERTTGACYAPLTAMLALALVALALVLVLLLALLQCRGMGQEKQSSYGLREPTSSPCDAGPSSVQLAASSTLQPGPGRSSTPSLPSFYLCCFCAPSSCSYPCFCASSCCHQPPAIRSARCSTCGGSAAEGRKQGERQPVSSLDARARVSPGAGR